MEKVVKTCTISSALESLTKLEDKFNDFEYPKVSIVIPTFNCSESITVTLESVLGQRYHDFEVFIIDAGSTDRTLDIVKGFRDKRVSIVSVSNYARYEMLNTGISHATGHYINFLFPGDFYIWNQTIMHMMALALGHDKPQLVFCGTLLRDGKNEVKVLYRHLSLKLLKRGNQPTSLQSCWFSASILRSLGKFNTHYRLRGGYDLLCRFALTRNLKTVSSSRVLTDYDLRWVTSRMVFRHFWETFTTIFKYFGFFTTLKWFILHQKDASRFLKLWMRSTRLALFGR